MLGARHDNRSQRTYSFPRMKLKNVTCIRCKRHFFVTGFRPLHGLIPLLLECGHIICDSCAKSKLDRFCPSCNKTEKSIDVESSLPLNMYALGLVVVSSNRTPETNETAICFTQPNSSRLKQQQSRSLCHECGIQATQQCLQCSALFCNGCFSKIHGRALQNHTKIKLSVTSSNSSLTIKTTCSDLCDEPLGYYCQKCEIACCSHCILRVHPRHDYVLLMTKNEEQLPVFYKAYDSVAESLQRIHQAQKKLKSTQIFPAELQNSENVERAITQHFAHLHGVLQNIEKNLIDELHYQRSYLNKNLNDLSMKLKVQEEELQSALLMAASAKENMEKVDISDLTMKLEQLADIPCHLVQDPVSKEQEITFDADKSIINALEKHCTLTVPSIPGFSLMPTKALPEDYQMEALCQELNTSSLLDKSFSSIKSVSIAAPAQRRKIDSPILVERSSEMVRVTHVVGPSCFYVQQISCQSKLTELSNGMGILAMKSKNVPVTVTINNLYIVQRNSDGKWYRGRVTDVSTNFLCEDKYEVLLVDYGMKEENVPITRIRNIAPQFATLPIMAIRCVLHDIVPNNGKWHPKATEVFKKLVSADAAVSMHVVSICGDTYYVDLCTVSPKDGSLASVTDTLIYLKYGSCVTSHKLMRTNPESIRKYYNEQLDIECYTDVQIQYVESPYCIYVQKVNGNKTHIFKMMQQMTTEFQQSTSASKFIYAPEIGLPCAAQGVDGHWCRCLITNISDDKSITVFYVDLGYSLVLSYDSVRTLPSRYMNFKTQSIKVSLRNVNPLDSDNGQWSTKTTEFMRDLLMDIERVKIVPFNKSGDAYSVSLYVNGNTNLSSLLVNNGFAKATGTRLLHDMTPTKRYKKKNKYKNKRPNDSEKSKEEMDTLKENADPFKIRILVREIVSPDCIYVADASCDNSIREEILQMQEFYKKYQCKENKEWRKDDVCVVYSPKDKCHCRAKILDIKPTGQVLVFFYDMGLEETVAMENVQPLLAKFSEIPANVFKVKLAGILPCGGSATWPTLSCQELRDILTENQKSQLFISKIEDVEDFPIPVELWIKQTKLDGPLAPTRIEINSVNRMLVEKGVALPIKDYAQKRDKILAIELKKQLQKRWKLKLETEINVKWSKINKDDEGNCDKDDDSDTLSETDISEKVFSSLQDSPNISSEYDSNSEEEPDNATPLPPKLSAWLPASAILEEKFIGVPTYLDYEGFVYLHSKKRNAKTLEFIEIKLAEFYKQPKIELCDTEWSPGDMCIAQYHGNGKWYRGKVVKIREDDIIEVEFIDYGNVEECAIGTLKKKVILGHIPIQTTKCKIDGLDSGNENGKWTTMELDQIHNLIIEKECEIRVLQTTDAYPVISLLLLPNNERDTKIDLITLLINEYHMNVKLPEEDQMESEICAANTSVASPDVIIEGYIEMNTSSSICTNIEITESHKGNDIILSGNSILFQSAGPEGENSNKEETDLENMSWQEVKAQLTTSTPQAESQESLSLKYTPITIPNDTDFIDIELCCSINATKFHAQLKENLHSELLNAYYIQYEHMMNDLQECAHTQPLIKTLDINTPCCAKFTDSLWYRCLIVESEKTPHSNDTEIKLLFVDFGNDEYKTVNLSNCNLHSLKDEWFGVPTMAIKCKLWNIQVASTANYDVLLPTLEKMYSILVVAKIKERDEEFLNVEIYENVESGEVMYKSLIDDGSFIFIDAQSAS